MNAMKAMIATTLLAGFSVTAGTLCHAEEYAPTRAMKPLYAISFDVGSKHAVSYFLSESGQCKLTVVVADAMVGDTLPTDLPVRFDASVDGGKDARFDTAEGKSLHFTCAQGAQAMFVKETPQLAASAVPQK